MNECVAVLGRWTLSAVVVLGSAAPARAADATPEGVEFFEKKVRPVLAEHCFRCHSSDKKEPKANLRLDSQAGLLKGGDNGPAVVPGKPEQSRLVRAVGYQDPDLRMPPKTKLADEHVADLTAWVKMGAPWPDEAGPNTITKDVFDLKERGKHWAWQPLKVVAPPAVKRRDWPRSPLDAFVLAELEAHGLAPAPPADRRTLLRRVTYDLIGLPPTPAEIDAFLADPSPDAYEKVVDRLLASPHYGERWGRHWLDLVRYAETAGHEFDTDYPEAFAYRDYVVRAFNADVPYDHLVREHLAGDLLPRPRRHPGEGYDESVLGTGFWFLGEAKHSPVDVRADQAERIDNQIDVFGKAFLGLTLACARCHDHKFDAVSTKDYYALAGYLQSSRYQRAFLDPPERGRDVRRRLAGLREQARRPAADAAARLLEENAGALAKDLAGDLKRHARVPPPGDGRAVVFEDFAGRAYDGWFVTGDAFGTGPTRKAEIVSGGDDRTPARGVVGPGVAHSGLVSDRLQGVLRSKTFVLDKKQVHYRVAGHGCQINLILDGFQQIRDPIYGGLAVTIDGLDRFAWRSQDVSMWQGHRAYVEIIDDGPGFVAVDQIVLSDGGPPADAPNRLLAGLADGPKEGLTFRCQQLLLDTAGRWRSAELDAERAALLNWALDEVSRRKLPAPSSEAHRADLARLAALRKQQQEAESLLPVPRRGMAMADGTGVNERVHVRGSHKNLGEEVPRRFLEAVAGPDQPAPAEGSGRLELAERMLHPSNALLPRVLVNRLWQHHFGEGLVRGVDNFGVLGEAPTHPELLDWLAAEFVRQGWSIKHVHRLLVLSGTYRMAGRADAKADEADPQNRLLHKMPLRRLEAEAIRDAILAVSGRLDRRMSGPGVPPHLTSFLVGRGRPAQSGPLDGGGRRSVYLNVRRNFLTPLLVAFDYPVPFTTIGRRGVSNVPAQALALMNNPFVVQQAEHWARRVLAEPGLSPRERVTALYVTAFARPPTDAELGDALDFLKEQARRHGRDDDPRAWADLCHVLVNVKEFIFIN